ncbi:MAG: ankyrin repeat domain-containing protein [Pyrinomonadaceae bacterium]
MSNPQDSKNSSPTKPLNSDPVRLLPVRPNLDQLKHQAKDFLRRIRSNDSDALAEFNAFHPHPPPDLSQIKLADAQLALARSYGSRSWPRMVQSCKLIDAIWRDDLETIRDLVTKHPNLIHENAGTRNNNWGPPLSYAANLGRDRVIKMLYDLGARDLEHAIGRAFLQGKIDTARMLHEIMGSPPPPEDALGGPAYTLSVTGTELVLELGGKVVDENGRSLAPVDVVLETDSRKPEAKHRILELYVQHGLTLPDTPVMALHRGRIDLIVHHLRRDPQLLQRTFTHEEIFPPDLGCHDEVLATQGTPLKGTTLLHLCVEYDELDIARWLLEQGMDPNVRATVDEEGFGGHTALFCTVVSQPNYWMNRTTQPQAAPFTQLLLDHGADPNIRASLRKKLHPGYAGRFDVENTYEYRNVTAVEWGRQFHAKVFVSEPAIRLIEAKIM